MGLKLSPPWVDYFNKINALFKKDPDVSVVLDEETKEIKLYVDNAAKADALNRILPTSKKFGNVEVKINVIPANGKEVVSFLDLFRIAFDGNEIVSRIKTGSSPITDNFNYIVFEKEVVQYFNDDLTSVNGFKSTLYEDIAKDVFEHAEGVYFCTETSDSNLVKAPLGEWP